MIAINHRFCFPDQPGGNKYCTNLGRGGMRSATARLLQALFDTRALQCEWREISVTQIGNHGEKYFHKNQTYAGTCNLTCNDE